MKSIFLIACGLLFGANAFGQIQPEDSISFADGMDRLSKKYQIKFAFDYADLNTQKMKWPAESMNLESALDQILDEKKYRYELRDGVVLIIPNHQKIKKNIAVTGIVVDEATGEPLPNATVSLPGSGKYTITNQEGKFSFVNVPYDTSSIYVRYLGYNQELLRINEYAEQNRINIKMETSSEYLDDIVVSDAAYQVIDFSSDPSHFSLDLKEFNSIANFGEPDVFRSVQLLPGVSATNETSSGLVIRGGTPEQNLVLFDGFTVYHLDHFFGIYSAFNSNVIKDVQLYKSGYGARWGTRVSGVLDITGKSGNAHKVSGNFGLNLVSANAMLEVPVSKKTSVLIAGRRAYTDIIQSSLYKKLFNHSQSNELNGTLIQSENFTDEPIQSDFYFYDMNVKVSHKISERDNIQLSYYQGKDDLNQSNTFFSEIDEGDFFLSEKIETEEHTEWGNRGGSVAYSRQWSNQLYSKATFSASNFFRNQNYMQEYELEYDSVGLEEVEIEGELFSFRNENQIDEYNLGVNLEYKLSDAHVLTGGVYSVFSNVRYQNFYEASLDDTDLDIEDKGNVTGAFGQYAYTPNPKLAINVGMRFSAYSLMPDLYFEPRLSAKYSISPLLDLKASFGKYYQFVVNVSGDDPTLNGGNFWLMGEQDGIPILESNHYVFGFHLNHRFFELDVEGFYKETDGLTNYIFSSSISGNQDVLELFSTGSGKVYGIDLMVTKSAGPYTGWIAYTLSNNRNKFEGLNDNEWYSSDFDERHEIKWVNMVNVKNWELSATWIYGSGKPYSTRTTANDSTFFDFGVNLDNPNTKRIPAYHKLDIGISYLQNLKKGQLKYGVNLLNVYNRKNIKSINEYSLSTTNEDDESQAPTTQKVELLGFTPSIFINYSF